MQNYLERRESYIRFFVSIYRWPGSWKSKARFKNEFVVDFYHYTIICTFFKKKNAALKLYLCPLKPQFSKFFGVLFCLYIIHICFLYKDRFNFFFCNQRPVFHLNLPFWFYGTYIVLESERSASTWIFDYFDSHSTIFELLDSTISIIAWYLTLKILIFI